MSNVKMCSPWQHYVNELKILFANDSDVTVEYDSDEYNASVFVDNEKKAVALAKLLPSYIKFGNINFTLSVIPANLKEEDPKAVLEAAFENNPVLDEVLAIEAVGYKNVYAMFEKRIVQFYDDNMGDPEGITSMTYEQVARDVFAGKPGVFFSTSK